MHNPNSVYAGWTTTLAIIVTLSLQVVANPGDLDTSFNGTGMVTTSITNSVDHNYGVAIQADGKIVTVGYSYNGSNFDFALARYNPDGTLDTSFSLDGKTTTDFGTNSSDEASDVALQTDGKIIVVGGASSPTASGFALARYNPDGSLDISFNGTGKLITPVFARANGVAIQPDGKIVVVGDGFIIARYLSNGSLDSSFDGDGVVMTVLDGLTYGAFDVALQGDGKIVAAGHIRIGPDNSAFALVRYNTNGSLDSSFDNDGKVTTDFGELYDEAQGVAIQPDGKIVAAGYHENEELGSVFAVTRYRTDGSLDPMFDSDGKVTTPFGLNSGAIAMTLQSNGKIVAAGGSYDGTTVVSAMIRYNSDGSLDTSFGIGGKVTTQVGSRSQFYGVTTQPDGRIVAAGPTFSSPNDDFSVARFIGDVSAPRRTPFDFDGDSKTDVSIFRPSVAEWWINRSSTGSTFAAQFGAASDTITPGDFTGDGKADIAFWRPSTGFWYVLRSEDFSFFSFPFGTSEDVPTVGDFDGDSRADATVYRPSSTTWFVRRSSDGGTTIQQFGAAGDVPVPADYDGDGRDDIAIYRPSVGQWWLNRSAAGLIAMTFGGGSDKPVQGDFTGDGKTDVATWRPSTGEWFVLRSEDFSYFSFPFGVSTDMPAPGDYDGDGKYDATVFRPSTSTWYSQRTTAGTLIQQFGSTGDRPVPSAFVP